MTDLSDFPITKRWPAPHPDRIQLYSLPTPNGIKITAMLEELGLLYDAHLVSFKTDDQFTPEFLSLNPNNKIPALLDPDGPGGKPFGIWETGAILIYLAEKTGKFLPQDPAAKAETIQWLMWQMGGLGPMFGQFGHFYVYAGSNMEDPYAQNRYADEARRLLGVLEQRLEGREFVMGAEITIADFAIWPWLRCALTENGYDAYQRLGGDDFPKVVAYMKRCMDRPASVRAVGIPARD